MKLKIMGKLILICTESWSSMLMRRYSTLIEPIESCKVKRYLTGGLEVVWYEGRDVKDVGHSQVVQDLLVLGVELVSQVQPSF